MNSTMKWIAGATLVFAGTTACGGSAPAPAPDEQEEATEDIQENDRISRERCEREFQLIRERPLESDISVVRACNRAGFRPQPRVNYSRERCEREFRLSFRSPLDADDSVLSDCDRAGLLPFDRLDEFLPR